MVNYEKGYIFINLKLSMPYKKRENFMNVCGIYV